MRKLLAILLLALCGPALAQVKISSLPTATTPLTGTEIVPCDQPGNATGTTKQCTTQSVGNLATTPAAIAALPAGTAPTGVEAFPVTQSGNTVKLTVSQLQGVAIPNAANGGTETILPQNTTGHNATNANWVCDAASNAGFLASGALYNDPVFTCGYNVTAVAANGSVASTALDPFGTGNWLEAEYEYNNGQTYDHGTTTGANSSTLTDSGKAWGVNQWAQWVIWDSTQGCSAIIASNTATVLTISGAWTASSGSCAVTPTTGDSYQILGRVGEDYQQVGRVTSNGSTYQRIRPNFLIWDKATALAQGALAPGAAVTITSATAANPPVFTTAVNHGLQAGSPNGYTAYVKFANMAGGTWGTQLNGNQYVATVTGANTFTVNLNATGFGTYTASSGTETAEAAVFSVGQIIGAQQGMYWALPSWNGTPSDYVATQTDGQFTVFGRPGSNTNAAVVLLKTDTLGQTVSIFQGTYKGVPTFSLYGGFSGQASTAVFQTFNAAGANPLTTLRLSQKDSATAVGNVGRDVSDNAVWNISNNGQTASTALMYMRPATSQTGDFIQMWDVTGNTTKEWYVDSSYFTHHRGLTDVGTTFTLGTGTGACASTSTLTGGATAGSFLCTGVAGASTQVINLPTSANGWACFASDVTSGVGWAQVIPIATNSAKISGTLTTASDRVVFSCQGF